MFLLLSCLLFVMKNSDLRIVFTNLQQAEGRLYVAVFDKKADFLQPDRARFQQVVPVRNTGNLEVIIPGVPDGAYAISCFHDVNGNGTLDKNWLGVPTEPYCFSNNARPRFRAPRWEEAKFSFIAGKTIPRLRLEKW